VWQNERIGVLVADDRYLPKERSPIEESRLVNLISFADMISLVILNAKLRDRSLVEAFRDLEHQLRSPLLNAGRIVHEILDHRPSKALADTAASTTVPTAPDIQSVLRTLHKVLGKARRVSRNTRLYAELSGYHPIRLRNLELLQPSMVNEMLAAAIREAELQRDDLLVEVDIPSLDVFETATVEFDTVLLEQVFGNVFDNVFKYAVKDSAVWVQAERKETHHQLLLRIENVARLTQEEAEKSTQRGFRGANAEEVAGEGSGLGLWIVDHIMRAHKGQVRLSVGADNRVVTEITFAEAKL
jgi:signal transduction histidine kinase